MCGVGETMHPRLLHYAVSGLGGLSVEVGYRLIGSRKGLAAMSCFQWHLSHLPTRVLLLGGGSEGGK